MYTMVTSSSAKRSWYDPWALSILCFFANASLDWRVLLAQATTCEPLCLRQFVKSLEIFPHPRIPHLDAIAPCSGAVLLRFTVALFRRGERGAYSWKIFSWKMVAEDDGEGKQKERDGEQKKLSKRPDRTPSQPSPITAQASHWRRGRRLHRRTRSRLA